MTADTRTAWRGYVAAVGQAQQTDLISDRALALAAYVAFVRLYCPWAAEALIAKAAPRFMDR